MNLEEIRLHWEQAGKQFQGGVRVSPTSRDPFLGTLEAENILSQLQGMQNVLEIGCGDGLHTAKYARQVQKLSAMDVSESLIAIGKKRMACEGVHNVDYKVGSVLDLKSSYENESFDLVISQRCLINLPTWDYQQCALRQVHDVLKRGGLLLLSEGFQDELDELNAIRRKVGLDEIKVVDYNRNFRKIDLEQFIKPYFKIVKVMDYGFYLLLSRVLYPLSVFPESPKHDSKVNEAAMAISRNLEIPAMQRYSYNLFYVLRKI